MKLKLFITSLFILSIPLMAEKSYSENIEFRDFTSEIGIVSVIFDKSGKGKESSLDTMGLYIEGKTKVNYKDYTPTTIFASMSKNGDFMQFTLRGGYEHNYLKRDGFIPYVSISGGMIYHHFLRDPIKGADNIDNNALSLLAIAEVGTKFLNGYTFSAKIGITDLKTDVNIQAETGTIQQKGFFFLGVGYIY